MEELARFTYKAFISYTTADRKWACWIQKTIERYRCPRQLKAGAGSSVHVPRKLGSVFLDKTDLGTSADLRKSIFEAIRQSEFFIVICSPESARSTWVNDEIIFFKELGRQKNIISVIVDGLPHGKGGGCFPPALFNQKTSARKSTVKLAEPAAADVRPEADGKQNVKIRVVSTLLGVEPDILKRREEALQRVRFSVIAFIAVVTTTLAIVAYYQRNAALYTQSLFFADLSKQLAGKPQRVFEDSATAAALLAVEALPKHFTRFLSRPHVSKAEASLYFALTNLREKKVIQHDNDALSVMFSPDSKLLLSTSADGKAYVLDVQTLNILTTFYGHFPNYVEGGAFNKDGTRIATTGADGKVKIWDPYTGNIFYTLRIMHDRGRAARLQFDDSGSVLMAVSKRGELKLWNPNTGEEKLCIDTESSDAFFTATLSPNGKNVLTTFGDTAQVRNAVNGKQLLSVRHDCGKNTICIIVSAAFDPDGSRFMTNGIGDTTRVWDILTGKELLALPKSEDLITSADFVNEGGWLVTLLSKGIVKVWDSNTGVLIVELVGHKDEVTKVVVASDCSFIVTASKDHTTRIWHTRTGKEIAVLRHFNAVSGVALSNDDTLVATSSHDWTTRLWAVTPHFGKPKLTFRGHKSEILDFKFSPEGNRVVTAGADGYVRIWGLANGGLLEEFVCHNDHVCSVAFDNSGHKLVTGANSGNAFVMDTFNQKKISVKSHKQPIHSVAFIPDGLSFITVSYDRTARVWDTKTAALITELHDDIDPKTKVSFSKDGSRLVLTSQVKAYVFNTHTWSKVKDYKVEPNQWPIAVFSPDGERIFLSWDWDSNIFNMRTTSYIKNDMTESKGVLQTLGNGKVHLVGHTDFITDAVFNQKGDNLATSSLDLTARVWEVSTGREIATLIGHDDAVNTVSFNRKADRILTTSLDGTARLWDVTSGEELFTFESQSSIRTAVFSPNGKDVATLANDGTLSIWALLPTGKELIDLANRVLPRGLSEEERKRYFLDDKK